MFRKYETLFILRPDLADDDSATVKKRLTKIINGAGGTEICYQDWGKKKLAYPIRKFPKGTYVYYRFLGDGAMVDELERIMRVADEVLRFMTVKLEDRVSPEGFDVEADMKGVYPFNIKPREPIVRTPPPTDAKATPTATKEGAEAATDKDAESKSEPKPEEKPEEKPEAKPEAEPKPKPEEKPEPKPEPEPEAKAEEPKTAKEEPAKAPEAEDKNADEKE